VNAGIMDRSKCGREYELDATSEQLHGIIRE
jgi:hypothetical protein